MTTRLAKIQNALASVYSQGGKFTPGGMVEACATDLDKKWENLVEGGRYSRGPEAEVQMVIWNWFPGGGTAEIAAKVVMGAVNE